MTNNGTKTSFSSKSRKINSGEAKKVGFNKKDTRNFFKRKRNVDSLNEDSNSDSISDKSEEWAEKDNKVTMMNICSNSDKHLISCEHHERFQQQFHSEALCCKCRPRLEMEKMTRNQQSALMQQKAMSAAGVNSNNNLFGTQTHIGSTGQSIVNGVLKVLDKKSGHNPFTSMQHTTNNNAHTMNLSNPGGLTNNAASVFNALQSSFSNANAFSGLQKRCDYNCTSCLNQKSTELYPGATPPPQISMPPRPSQSQPGSFGDYQMENRAHMNSVDKSSFWSPQNSTAGVNTNGSFFQPMNNQRNSMMNFNSNNMGPFQSATEPKYISPYLGGAFGSSPETAQQAFNNAPTFSQFRPQWAGSQQQPKMPSSFKGAQNTGANVHRNIPNRPFKFS